MRNLFFAAVVLPLLIFGGWYLLRELSRAMEDLLR